MNKSKRIKQEIIKSIFFFALFIAVYISLSKTSLIPHLSGIVSDWFIAHRVEFINPFAISFEYVGHWPLPALVAVIMLLKKETRFSYGIPLAASVSVSVGMYELFKNIFKYSRPDPERWLVTEHGYSFPSGHTLNNTVFWTVLAMLLVYYFRTNGKSLPIYKKDRSTQVYPKSSRSCNFFRVVLFIWPLIIAVSRVYVGVHWPTDVLGAWFLAGCLINLCKAIIFKGEYYE